MNVLNSMVPLFCLAILLALVSPAKPDGKLIWSVCQKTHRPVFCTDCLRSAPGSHTVGPRGLALLSIACSENDIKSMMQNTGDLVRSTPISSVQVLLQDCMKSFRIALDNFPIIRSSVNGGDYITAANGVDITVRNVNSCMLGFRNNPSVPVPSELPAWCDNAAERCRVTSEILKSI